MKTTENGMMKRILVGLAAVSLVCLLSLQGCARPTSKSDFLGKNVELSVCPEEKNKLWWEQSGFNWHQYKKVMIDPISLAGDAATDNNHSNQEDLNELQNYFQKAVVEQLAPEFQLTNQPGPDVLRVRPVITKIIRSNPLLNVVTTAAVFIPMDMGGASIEVEFLDSLTDRRVAAMVETKLGTPLELIGSFSSLGHTKNAIDDWASELKLALVENP